jgi:hypothetical protein
LSTQIVHTIIDFSLAISILSIYPLLYLPPICSSISPLSAPLSTTYLLLYLSPIFSSIPYKVRQLYGGDGEEVDIVLIDDTEDNVATAQELGYKGVHVKGG